MKYLGLKSASEDVATQDDLTGITIATWTAVTFTNSFANVGSPYSNVEYFKDPFGIVHLRGVMFKNPTSTAAAFTLPSGYRPPGNVNFPVVVFGGIGIVQVTTAGVVTVNSGSTAASVDLGSISFRV